MKLKNYKERIDSSPEEIKREVKHNFDILDRIHQLLNEKFGGKQKLLAEKMGKSEAEVSKWINGNQNFTLRTISKLETAFQAPIIAVCSNSVEGTFKQVTFSYNELQTQMVVSQSGIELLPVEKFKLMRSNHDSPENQPELI